MPWEVEIMELPVEKILRKERIAYRLIKLPAKAYTFDDVVKYLKDDLNSDKKANLNLEEICKTIILKGKKTNKKFAVLLKGGDRINFLAAKELFKERATIADASEVKEVSGVEPGAVCPFLLNVPLFVDKKVKDLENIHCGSGNHLYGLEFKTEELAKAVNYKIVDLAKCHEK